MYVTNVTRAASELTPYLLGSMVVVVSWYWDAFHLQESSIFSKLKGKWMEQYKGRYYKKTSFSLQSLGKSKSFRRTMTQCP